MVTNPPAVVEGVIVAVSPSDAFGAGGPSALVAIPGERAAAVPAALADRSVVVMLAAGGT